MREPHRPATANVELNTVARYSWIQYHRVFLLMLFASHSSHVPVHLVSTPTAFFNPSPRMNSHGRFSNATALFYPSLCALPSTAELDSTHSLYFHLHLPPSSPHPQPSLTAHHDRGEEGRHPTTVSDCTWWAVRQQKYLFRWIRTIRKLAHPS